jgi:uncharacterized repeat protein (TIGR03803 family)
LPLNKPLVTLVTFNGANGAKPESGLVEGTDGNFYGTTYAGGLDGKGTIFRVSPEGTFKTLVAFNGANGANPKSALLLGKDGNFYGTTFNGGAANKGMLFSITPQGKLTPLVTFKGANGTNPGGLARGGDGNFYGTTYAGGANGLGVVFKYDPDPQFVVLVSFNGENGANPQAELSQSSDGNLYGTTFGGGQYKKGTVFSITPEGVFTALVSFDGTNGSNPNSELVEWSNGFFYLERIWENLKIKASTVQWSGVNFCGTTSSGGDHNDGTVFRVSQDGSLIVLVSFTGTGGKQVGAMPNSVIPGNDGNLYGTTYFGGSENKGTVYRIFLQLWEQTPPPGADKNKPPPFNPPPLISP